MSCVRKGNHAHLTANLLHSHTAAMKKLSQLVWLVLAYVHESASNVPSPAPTSPCIPSDECSNVSSYYCNTDLSLRGAALATVLQIRVASPHAVIPYTSSSTDCWDALSILDADPSSVDHVIEIYARASVNVSLHGDTSGWNREHM